MVTENIRPTKELQKIMDDLLKRIDDIFSFKKTTRTLIKSKENQNEQSTVISIELEKGHEKRNSDLPKTIMFKNEDDVKNTFAMIRN